MTKRRAVVKNSSKHILFLLASGQANTRTELAHLTGSPLSTISDTVQSLIRQGLVSDEGSVCFSGGRPRQVLAISHSDEFALVADIGRHHVRAGIARYGGSTELVRTSQFDTFKGPEPGLQALDSIFESVLSQASGSFRSIGIALPSPVNLDTGSPNQPATMPGWDGYPVRRHFEEHFGVPVTVDNDANLLAVGESSFRRLSHSNLIAVKVGTGIGAGVIVGGNLYHGAWNEAGDITHVRVVDSNPLRCSCGQMGCLETVASGYALVRTLSEAGIAVSQTMDVVDLARREVPEVVSALRRAGAYLGQVLAVSVNFFNPEAVYIGGIFSTLKPFISAVQQEIRQRCHPLVMKGLAIERTQSGIDAEFIGAGVFALQQALRNDMQTFMRQ
ncbi:ROK family protein [Bifidobacterium sp.]|uniref:ROK family protein n=1 Tax=Bifidobacterium sp. TaxID=41200 RepID=UPI0039EB886A